MSASIADLAKEIRASGRRLALAIEALARNADELAGASQERPTASDAKKVGPATAKPVQPSAPETTEAQKRRERLIEEQFNQGSETRKGWKDAFGDPSAPSRSPRKPKK